MERGYYECSRFHRSETSKSTAAVLLPDDAHPLLVATGIPDATSTRVWFRSPHAGDVELTCHDRAADRVVWRTSLAIPESDPEDRTRSLPIDGLAPDTEYRVHVSPVRSPALAAGANFRTAPANGSTAPAEWSFGFGSCHMPFEPDGRLSTAADEMLGTARAALQGADARFFVAIGDQMYTDLPRQHSLFDAGFLRERLRRLGVTADAIEHPKQCPPEVVRALYQERYRQFWAVPAWRELLGDLPMAMMWDDHEIVDNWGSAHDHGDAGWDAVVQGARAAAIDYEQAIHRAKADVPDTFDHVVDRGATSLLLLDLRTRRRPADAQGSRPRVLSEAQFDWLDRRLAERRDQAFVFVVTTVPFAHVPGRAVRFLSRLLPRSGDLADRWPTVEHRADRDRLLERLREQAMAEHRPRVILLSGDIHAAAAQVITWPDGASGGRRPAALHQWISSPISNRSHPWARRVSAAAVRATKTLRVRGAPWQVALSRGADGADTNPLSSMNVGIVTIRESEARARLRLFGPRRLGFDSGWI